MNNYFNQIFHNIRKKWLFIVGCAIICSGLLMAEKLIFNQYVIQSGSVHFEIMVKVNNAMNANNPFYQNKVQYDKFFSSYAFLNSFIADSKQEIDYTKLNKGWNDLSQQDKLKWMQKKLIVNNYNDGIFQIIFLVDDSDAKSLEYIKDNMDLFSEVILREFSKELKLIDRDNELKIINGVQLLPETQIVSKGSVVLKYGALGIVLGIIVGMTVVVIHTLRKKDD